MHTRWIIFLAALAVTTLILVQPSAEPVVGPAAPPGDPTPARELLLTLGHVVAFTGLTTLACWTFNAQMAFRPALLLAVGFCVIYGLLTELAQTFVPDRNASLWDMAVNTTVTLIVAFVIDRAHRHFMEPQP
jgi:VanZ family protein